MVLVSSLAVVSSLVTTSAFPLSCERFLGTQCRLGPVQRLFCPVFTFQRHQACAWQPSFTLKRLVYSFLQFVLREDGEKRCTNVVICFARCLLFTATNYAISESLAVLFK